MNEFCPLRHSGQRPAASRDSPTARVQQLLQLLFFFSRGFFFEISKRKLEKFRANCKNKDIRNLKLQFSLQCHTEFPSGDLLGSKRKRACRSPSQLNTPRTRFVLDSADPLVLVLVIHCLPVVVWSFAAGRGGAGRGLRLSPNQFHLELTPASA